MSKSVADSLYKEDWLAILSALNRARPMGQHNHHLADHPYPSNCKHCIDIKEHERVVGLVTAALVDTP